MRMRWIMLATCMACAPAAAQDRLTHYGFFDLELEGTNRPGTPRWTFDQHHFNLIGIYRLDDHWRVFAEVEWEHGPQIEAAQGSGEVTLERAVVEYQHSDAFGLKIGKFLPPFGLYNLRHDATPTFLSTTLPSAVYSGSRFNTVGGRQRLFAKFGTGLQLGGTVFAGRWLGEYALYVTNGRGPAPAEADNNDNKGIGGRLRMRIPGEVVQVGASYYTDRNGEAGDTRQHSMGLDLTVGGGGFLIESEFFVPRLERVEAGVPNGTFRSGRGWYVQASRMLVGRLTPFVRYDSFDPDVRATADGETEVVVGLNWSVTGTVFLKSEVQFRRFQDPARLGYEVFPNSIAVAF